MIQLNPVFVAVANYSLLFAGAYEVFAIMQLTNSHCEKIKKAIIVFLSVISIIQAGLVTVNVVSHLRISLVTAALSALCLIILYFLMKPKNSTFLQKMIGMFFLFTAGSLILRSFETFALHAKYHLLTPGFVQILTFTSMFAVMIVSGFGIPLLAKERADEVILIAATYDGLTSIYNRKYFFEEAEKEMEYAKRKKCPFSLIMLDIDHFKIINDTYGHQKGDLVLKEFAKTISGALRKYDLFGRVGGEEFLIFLKDVPKEEAYVVAEKLRTLIETSNVDGIRYTISLGVCSIEPNMGKENNFDEILRQCDLALYEAKNSGRNKTIQKIN